MHVAARHHQNEGVRRAGRGALAEPMRAIPVVSGVIRRNYRIREQPKVKRSRCLLMMQIQVHN